MSLIATAHSVTQAVRVILDFCDENVSESYFITIQANTPPPREPESIPDEPYLQQTEVLKRISYPYQWVDRLPGYVPGLGVPQSTVRIIEADPKFQPDPLRLYLFKHELSRVYGVSQNQVEDVAKRAKARNQPIPYAVSTFKDPLGGPDGPNMKMYHRHKFAEALAADKPPALAR